MVGPCAAPGLQAWDSRLIEGHVMHVTQITVAGSPASTQKIGRPDIL